MTNELGSFEATINGSKMNRSEQTALAILIEPGPATQGIGDVLCWPQRW